MAREKAARLRLLNVDLFCRGRDSNPHGGCPPENFKSLRFDHNHAKSFILFLPTCESV